MTLKELYEKLKLLPGHENIILEDYRITMDIYDPGNPAEAHFYLTGPDSFYLYLTEIDQGDHRSFEEYSADTIT
tara:strand:- start:736 stop:957 length:222 start_codon:yes stop_codon:yes gene_type:complete